MGRISLQASKCLQSVGSGGQLTGTDWILAPPVATVPARPCSPCPAGGRGCPVTETAKEFAETLVSHYQPPHPLIVPVFLVKLANCIRVLCWPQSGSNSGAICFYLFMFGCAGSVLLLQAFSPSEKSRGYSLVVAFRLLICGFSSYGHGL